MNRRRRHYRRNPAIFGKSFTIPSLQPVLFAGAGYVGTGWLENLLTIGSTNSDGTTTAPIIPTSITGSTVGKYAVKIGCVIATGYLAKLALGGERAKWVAIGGGVNVLVAAAKEFGPSIPGLSAYTPLRGYQPGLAARKPVLFGQRSAPVNYDFGAQLGDRGSR